MIMLYAVFIAGYVTYMYVTRRERAALVVRTEERSTFPHRLATHVMLCVEYTEDMLPPPRKKPSKDIITYSHFLNQTKKRRFIALDVDGMDGRYIDPQWTPPPCADLALMVENAAHLASLNKLESPQVSELEKTRICRTLLDEYRGIRIHAAHLMDDFNFELF